MRYVDRDPVTKEVVSTFACEQYPKQEVLPDDHADIATFNAKRAAIQAASLDRMRVLRELVDAKIASDTANKAV